MHRKACWRQLPKSMSIINISIDTQRLTYSSGDGLIKTYPVSTSFKGTGQNIDSGMTPLGHHIIRAKIGEGQPINSVFVGRRPTGEIFNFELMEHYPGRDWILSRIMWLSGKEIGFNRLGNVDTMRRYIYIHGTPYEDELGTAVSHGCIRMSNADVVELFSLVNVGCRVNINE